MKIALEEGRPNVKPQLLVQVLDKPVKEMHRPLIRLMNERVITFNQPDVAMLFLQWRQVGIVFPQGGTRCSDVGEKSVWIARVQIAHRRGQHHNIAGRLKIGEDDLLHGNSNSLGQFSTLGLRAGWQWNGDKRGGKSRLVAPLASCVHIAERE